MASIGKISEPDDISKLAVTSTPMVILKSQLNNSPTRYLSPSPDPADIKLQSTRAPSSSSPGNGNRANTPPKSTQKSAKRKLVRNFEPTWENGECTFVLNEALSQPERIKLAFGVPELLKEKRVLTPAELESTGYTEAEPDKMYYIKTPSGRHPGAIRMSAQFLKKHGLLQRLAPLRAKLLSEDFKQKVLEVSGRTGHKLKETGTRFQFGLTQKPHFGVNTIQLGKLTQAVEELEAQDFIVQLTDIVSEATRLVIPGIDDYGREQRWHQNASLTMGSRKNHVHTNIQLNYTKEGEKLTNSLKKFGGVHRDIQNDPTVLTAIVSLSHLSEDYFGGRFNVTSLHLTAPLLPYEITLFPGRFFHCSTGVGTYSVPRGSPLRIPPPEPGLIPPLPEGTEFMRFVTPLWTSERCMNPELKCLNEHFYKSPGETIFEDKAHQYEWMMRFYIVKEPEIRLRIGNKVTSEIGSGPQQLITAFRTVKTGENKVEVAELASSFPRHGDPEHYTQLFEYADLSTGIFVRPNKEAARETLEALLKDDHEFESLSKEMKELITTIGANSSSVPAYARSSGALRKAITARTDNTRKTNNTRRYKSDSGNGKLDFMSSELVELMENFTGAEMSSPADEDLASAMAAIGTALKCLIVYTMKQGKSSPTNI
ncbi:hypothetical protein BDZ45DRAFT_745861 [Acephala macrosclerotiorum]|nr:hypothetical protein BDZ45DRAFT_745861 [Acephala macrosclerotiorum]